MYVLSLLVIGRSFMMYKSWFFLKNIFCRSCLQSGGAEQRYQHVLRGSTALCPWWQRGRMTLRILGLASSPKGEIVGILAQVWRYGTGVVLDGNSLGWQISVQTTRMKRNLIYACSLSPSCVYALVRYILSRVYAGALYTKSRIHAVSWTEKSVHVEKLTFGPW